MCYSGRGGWAELWGQGATPVNRLAGRVVPTLGAEAFFELT